MPWMATTAPGGASAWRSALNVVIPAHNSGAASIGFIDSGTLTSPLARAYTISA